MSDQSFSSPHMASPLTPDSLPASTASQTYAFPASDIQNPTASASLPSSGPKRSRLSIDWSSYEKATQNNEEAWKRKRLERASRQSQVWGSSGSSISRTSSLVPSYPIVQADPPLPLTSKPGIRAPATTECAGAGVTTTSSSLCPMSVLRPPTSDAQRVIELETDGDDDDAFLKRLMAQADQMRQVEKKLEEQLDACSLDPNKNNDERITTQSKPSVMGQRRIDIMTDTRDERRQKAITYLESMFLGFLDDLVESTATLNERQMLGRKKGRRSKRKLDDEGSGSQDPSSQESERKVGVEMRLKNRSTGGDQVVAFPDDPVHPPKVPALVKMTRQMRVAQLLYEAILTGCVTTKRDIYYKDVQLFRTQPVVDKLVDDIVATAGLQRQDFMVCATAKGLVASSVLQVHLRSGEQLSLSFSNASLIPAVERIGFLTTNRALEWVLIVEKDAVFQTLLGLDLLGQPDIGSGVLITGKGYPDLATLQLCNLISQTFPCVAFHALVDADPHGIDIMQVYARGSRTSKHSRDHAGLALGDKLQWMGLKATQWSALGVRHGDLLHLTDEDVTKAMAMLRRPDLAAECKRELQNMLHLNRKAEIQILSSVDSGDTIHESLFGEPNQVSAAKKGMKGGLLEYVVAGLKGL